MSPPAVAPLSEAPGGPVAAAVVLLKGVEGDEEAVGCGGLPVIVTPKVVSARGAVVDVVVAVLIVVAAADDGNDVVGVVVVVEVVGPMQDSACMIQTTRRTQQHLV